MSRTDIVRGLEMGLTEGKSEDVPVSKKNIRSAAVKLAKSFETMNGKSLVQLWHMAQEAYEQDDYGRRHHGANNAHVRSGEDFGFYLAMRAQGHGVGWDDDVMGAYNIIKHPHIEVY